MVLRQYPHQIIQRLTLQWAVVLSLLLAAGGLGGCDVFKRSPLPDMGPRLPNSVKLTFDPSLTSLKMQYQNGCASLRILDVGPGIESVLTDAAAKNFQAVTVTGGAPGPIPPDTEILVTLQRSGLKLWQDNLYDRVPADITFEALLTFKDAAGKELGQQTITIAHNERLILEPTQKRCDYGNVDEFVYDAGVKLSVQFILAARSQLASAGSAPLASAGSTPSEKVAASSSPGRPAPPPAAVEAKGAPSTLSFKATMLDENGNLVFESGERIRVRVDLVNAGSQELQNVTATITGSPSLLAQFPATTLSAGRLQPGQSRSLEFVATLPQGPQQQKAELLVSVFDPAAGAPPSQALSLSIQPTGVTADDVDQVPAAAAGFKRPHTYLLSIGVGSYRDQHLSIRKYAASDAEILTSYFQSLGGLPASNVRLLQDWKALRPDIDEALLDWLPPHMNKEAVVIVYFAGLATVSSSGEVFLLPYDGNATNTSRAYPLKDLEAALARLKAKHTILLFDGMVARLGGESRAKSTVPQWSPAGNSTLHIIASNGIGRIIEDDKHRHGLFTYYFLRAMRGEADSNHDGEVTLGEIVLYLTQKVLWASKTQYGQEQRPLVLPQFRNGDPAASFPLSRLATAQARETP